MKKKQICLYVVIAILLLVCVGAATALLYKDVLVPNQKYNTALSLIEKEDYISAYDILNSLGNYKDSLTKKEEIYDLYKIHVKIADLQIGETIRLGEYEQDNNTDNGAEKIEWIVLAKEPGRALVISKYALDAQPYHDAYESVFWGLSSLRKWLNEDFYSMAFFEDEQSQIIEAYVPSHDFSDYATSSGFSTNDRLFLLSFSEIGAYMPEIENRVCPVTEYAKAQGVYETKKGTCRWWTRTSGGLQDRASYVGYMGHINPLGCFVDTPNYGVRPAMWIGI